MVKFLGLGLLSILLLSGCGTAREWFRSDAEAAAAPVALATIADARSVQRLWSHSLGEPEAGFGLRQRPALDGSTVYAVTGVGALHAIDIETGATRWETRLSEISNRRGWRFWQTRITDGGLHSSVAVGEGLVVVVGRTGAVYAVNAGDGSLRWESQASAEVQAAPLIVRGLVVIRSQDGRTVALDATSGERRWSHQRSIPSLSSLGASAPASAVGLVLVGNEDGMVLALRAEDGVPVWEAMVAEPEGRSELERIADIDGDLAIGANVLYATSVRGVTAAVALASGQLLWTRENGGPNGLELTPTGVLLADKGGTLWSLDRDNGNALWRQDALLRRQPTAPVLAGGLAVVGDVEGYLHWFDPQTGILRARTQLQSARIVAAPLASPTGVVVAVSDEGRLAAFRVAE